MASYRVTANCCEMGENAARVNAYGLQHHIPLRQVEVAKVLHDKFRRV